MDDATEKRSHRLNPLPFFPAVLPFIFDPSQFQLIHADANSTLENRIRMREKKIAVNLESQGGSILVNSNLRAYKT